MVVPTQLKAVVTFVYIFDQFCISQVMCSPLPFTIESHDKVYRLYQSKLKAVVLSVRLPRLSLQEKTFATLSTLNRGMLVYAMQLHLQ
jgi:hypothetical protein